MRLSVKALAITIGALWALCILLVGLLNATSGYGQAFLDLLTSLYPGYDAVATPAEIITGTLYGALDGFVSGAVLAWLYNRLLPVR